MSGFCLSININVATTDIFEDLQTTCIETFGITADDYILTGVMEGGGGDVPPPTISGIIAQPPLLEQALPGGSNGTTNIYFYVRYVDCNPLPVIGYGIVLNAISYDIQDILVDQAGGALLKLKRNA
jgi:hypothetical protein